MRTNDALIRRLLEAAAPTASGAFERLLEKEINILRSIRERASDSQKHLREFLSTESQRDSTFPRVLSREDDDYLGGSFARHVKNWPLDDIDVYFPLDGHDLFYSSYGARLPYTVVSDGVLHTNPLLNPRWMDGTNISPNKLINEFTAVLRRHYSEQDVQADGQAITIRMKQGETESGDGLGFDIVPCFSMRPHDGSEQAFYIIPDGAGGWIRTNPRLDQDIAERLHQNNEKTFRKTVKLLKFWNTEQFGGLLSSYYIELAVAREFSARNAKGETIKSLPFAVALGFWAVNAAVVAGDQTSWIAQAPPVQSGPLTEDQRRLLAASSTTAKYAWDKELAREMPAALEAWGRVFGPAFTAALT